MPLHTHTMLNSFIPSLPFVNLFSHPNFYHPSLLNAFSLSVVSRVLIFPLLILVYSSLLLHDFNLACRKHFSTLMKACFKKKRKLMMSMQLHLYFPLSNAFYRNYSYASILTLSASNSFKTFHRKVRVWGGGCSRENTNDTFSSWVIPTPETSLLWEPLKGFPFMYLP